MRALGDLLRRHGAAAALVVLVAFNALFTPNFASAANLRNVLLQVAPTVLVSVGMTLVVCAGGIDLSVGSVMAVASAAAALASGYGAAAAVAAGLTAGALLGAVNGTLAGWFRVEPFIVTLAVQIAARGLAQVLSSGGETSAVTDPAFEWLGRGRVGPVPVPVVLAAAAVALALAVLKATVLGRYFLAVGGNEAAAGIAGVPIAGTRLIAYLASALLAALAGLIDTARMGTTDPSNLGAGMEFSAIFAVVLGGTPLTGGRATLLGSVWGALLLAGLGASFNMLLVPYAWALLVQAAVVLLAVWAQRPASARVGLR